MFTDFAPGHAINYIERPGIGQKPWPMFRVVPKFRVMVEDAAAESGNNPEVATPAMMFFAGPDNLVVMRMIMNDSPVDQLATVAYGVSHGELPAPEWVAYAAEGWATEPTPGDPRDFTLEPGELHDRFSIGMTGVNEGIVANMRARDGSGWTYTQGYTRVGTESLRWGESIESTLDEAVEVGGRVDRLLRIMVGLQEWDGF
jgi:hypothetical protein